MKYLHVKDIMKHHPSYTDRETKWVKIFMDMIDVSPEYSRLMEIDKWRLVGFIMLEIQFGKEVLIDEEYLTLKGYNFNERSLAATIEALSPLIELKPEPSEEGLVLRRTIKPKTEKELQIDKDCKELFDFWNKQKVVVHRDYKKYYPTIKARLQAYKIEELKIAIANYAMVLSGKEYYWSYRWTIDQFFLRKNALDKFMKENFKLDDYRKKLGLENSIDNKIKELEEFENN